MVNVLNKQYLPRNMYSITEWVVMFLMGSFIGWLIEVTYRGVVGRKFSNPGFLSGPFVPLYGFSVCFIYTVAFLEMHWLLKLASVVAFITTLELLTGMIFMKVFHIRLWDFSEVKWNFRGIIAPKFSLYWGLVSLGYFFATHPILIWILNTLEIYPILLVLLYVILAAVGMDTYFSFEEAVKIKHSIKGKKILRFDKIKNLW